MNFDNEKMNRSNNSLIILRIALGVIFFAHGSQKLLGWFGGFGFDGTMQFFQQQLGIPYILALLAILTEFFGGIFLILGLFTRISAVFIAVVMAVALFTVHLSQGFFIGGGKVGIEFVFALLFMSLYLAINGAGKLSLDNVLKNYTKNETLKKILS